ncbi:hypothetical protein JRI60_00070 [Archangium violaceum]|uniref:hypothetical protein n=1 Tax=Archangium violaceum TaxID=83451 RepID=UPI00194F5910|nr:hypothetical protein [Archangium violaceum]QRN97527.1 hypothetical protein JRI60_00070 [Archangium violaceum]
MTNPVWPVRDGSEAPVPRTLEREPEPTWTVARAFARCGFSEDEWLVLDGAPLRVFLYVALVDGPVHPAEREACRRVLGEGLLSRSPLVERVCREALCRLDAPGWDFLSERPDLEPLRPVCERVARRLGLGEAWRLRHLLLDVGRRVARASSGLLGRVGGVRREERRALGCLSEALGLPAR